MSCSYILVTPAFNEARHIEITIQSVLEQTVRPLQWIIVDDGSTDATPEIIKKYAARYPWIEYIRRDKEPDQMYFASNVFAIEKGASSIKEKEFEFLGILDADISLPRDYYAAIIGRMEQDEKLGIAGGIYENLVDGKLHPVLNDRRSTPKAIMIFRRKCFEDIGGFLPLKYGGEDTAACVMARMKGWKVWSYPDVKVVHHRPTGMGNVKNLLNAKYHLGFYEYGLGSHPLFVMIKSLKRAFKEKPYIVGGMARLLGFIMGYVKIKHRIVSVEFIRFIRNEQMGRILSLNAIPESNQVNDDSRIDDADRM